MRRSVGTWFGLFRKRVWVKPFVAAFAVSILGAGAGGAVGYSHVSLETVIYSWQETEAELFVTDEYGTFADYPSSTQFVDMGSNRVTFPLTEPHQRTSFIQRLDPCSCPWGIAVGRIGLSSPFVYDATSPEDWIAGGSNEGFITDANIQLIQNRLPETDPQIVVYLDVSEFIQRSTFAGAIAGAAIALLSLGVSIFVFLRVRERVFPRGLVTVRRASSGKLPPWVAWVTGVILALGVGQMLAGSLQTGITIDEGFHVGHLQNFLDGRSYSSESYGPAAALVGHSVNIALGNEVWGAVSSAPEAFFGRHLAMALLGILAVGAVAVSTGLMFRSWTWGLIGGAFLVSLPLWVGHSMFNIKDVPAGAGYALFTAGLIALIVPHLRLATRFGVGAILLLGGIALGVGTRPGLWPMFVASAVVALLAWSIAQFLRRSHMSAGARRNVVAGIVGGVFLFSVALVALLIFTELGRELADAVTRSLDHPWTKSRRYAGLRVFNRPDALLVFQILLSQIPAGISFLFLVGSVAGVLYLVTDIRRGTTLRPASMVFSVGAVQVFTPFIVVAVFSPVLYDGIRQILFVLPGVAIIATMGLWAVMQAALRLFESRRAVKGALGVALALMLGFVTVDQLRLFPYNYVYTNVIAQGAGMSGAWESDYWDSSMREAIADSVAQGDPITCGFTHQTFWNLSDLRDPCVTISPYLPRLAPAAESTLGEREFWTIRSERDLMQYGPRPFNCFPESAVTRTLRFETLVMTRLYRCIDY